MCRTASELFATTADAYLLLGEIDENMYTCETADGAGRSKTDAMRRIARLVCADLSEIREEEIYEIAGQVKEKQVSTLAEAISEVAERNGLKKIVAAGLGRISDKRSCRKTWFRMHFGFRALGRGNFKGLSGICCCSTAGCLKFQVSSQLNRK